MSQKNLHNYFNIIVAYPVMICNSVLCQGVVPKSSKKGPILLKNREKLTFQREKNSLLR